MRLLLFFCLFFKKIVRLVPPTSDASDGSTQPNHELHQPYCYSREDIIQVHDQLEVSRKGRKNQCWRIFSKMYFVVAESVELS